MLEDEEARAKVVSGSGMLCIAAKGVVGGARVRLLLMKRTQMQRSFSFLSLSLRLSLVPINWSLSLMPINWRRVVQALVRQYEAEQTGHSS